MCEESAPEIVSEMSKNVVMCITQWKLSQSLERLKTSADFRFQFNRPVLWRLGRSRRGLRLRSRTSGDFWSRIFTGRMISCRPTNSATDWWGITQVEEEYWYHSTVLRCCTIREVYGKRTLLQGTNIAAGKCRGIVIGTGLNTEIGLLQCDYHSSHFKR